MHRIDAEGHHENTFTDGDASGPKVIPATVVDAAWLNAIQEELCALLFQRGFSLQKGEHTQLAAAIGRPLSALEQQVKELHADIILIKGELKI